MTKTTYRIRLAFLLGIYLALAGTSGLWGQAVAEQWQSLRDSYTKREFRIPMRDGVRLFTAVYIPKDTTQHYPFLMVRTPYSVRPYGEDQYPASLGPSRLFTDEGYIFVYQDVRGCYMSEGQFVNMTPYVTDKVSGNDVDESSDTYDTIEWLLANIPRNNGRVGQWGISYPGFYAAAGMIEAHPALVAVSPQAPIGDWWYDDFHHHGAFFLAHSFSFLYSYGRPRLEPTTLGNPRFRYPTPDGYQFFLNLGPLPNADQLYFHGDVTYWNEIIAHPNYDAFWQASNIVPHLRNVAPAVMTVAGWFDAEDLYGPFNIYQSIEEQNPGIFNILVAGPWHHGGWARTDGEGLGNIQFGSPTGVFYRENIELPFFNYYLKDQGELALPEAYAFMTGANEWRTFDEWPPDNLVSQSLYFHADGSLSFKAPLSLREVWDEYLSDPDQPVPYTQEITTGMTRAYMTDDQRFAARRPDVLAYQTEVLDEDVILAGPIMADLWVSTSGTDSDWIVKLIDVFPDTARDHDDLSDGQRMGGYQMMVRSEVIRGRFRNSYEHPEPFVPDEPTNVSFVLQDVFHNFQRGHRIMVQIQSTWFPLVDRNPQQYVGNIFEAQEKDFIVATQRVYRSLRHPSRLQVSVLPAGE